jgi:hypothetical protein
MVLFDRDLLTSHSAVDKTGNRLIVADAPDLMTSFELLFVAGIHRSTKHC